MEHHLLHAFPVAPLEEKHRFKVSLCTPLPEVVAGGDVLVLDLATLLQNNHPSACSLIYVYVKDEYDGYHVCRIQSTPPGDNPSLLRGGVAYRVPQSLVGQRLEIGWNCGVRYESMDASQFRPEYRTRLGSVRVAQHKKVPTANPLPKKMKWCIRGYHNELAKHLKKYPSNEALIMGACHLIVAAVTSAKLIDAVCQLEATQAHMNAANIFGMGLRAVIEQTPGVLLGILGEWACPHVVGNLGGIVGLRISSEDAEVFCTCTVTGVKLGSLVPAVDPVTGAAAGAAVGALFLAIGHDKTTDDCFFCLF